MSSQAVSNAKKMGWPLREVTTGIFEAEAPGGYKFYLEDKEQLKQGETYTLTHSYWCSQQIYEWDIRKGCAFVSMAFYETKHVSLFSLFLCCFPSQECATEFKTAIYS